MTLEVIEPTTKEIIAPALQVALGELSWEQANTQYVGLNLPCIHCWQELQRRATEGRRDIRSVFRKANGTEPVIEGFNGPEGSVTFDQSDSLINAKFKKGHKREGHRRWMHFAHKKGLAEQFGELPCHDPRKQDHALAVAVFRRYLDKQYCREHPKTMVKVQEEKRIIIEPGAPPITRRPDLIVEINGVLVECVEVQRSSISLENLTARTQHLQSVCSKVTWYVHKGIYHSGSFAANRDWLHEQGIPYFYYWIDDDLRIRFSEGKPKKAIRRRVTTASSDLPERPGRGTCRAIYSSESPAITVEEKSVHPSQEDPIFVEHKEDRNLVTSGYITTPLSSQRGKPIIREPTYSVSSSTRLDDITMPQGAYSKFSIGDEVELLIEGDEKVEGAIRSFHQGVPMVWFTDKKRERTRLPTHPSRINKLVKNEPESPQQMSLFI